MNKTINRSDDLSHGKFWREHWEEIRSNTGDHNTGWNNSGYFNSGDRNTGNWNSGWFNSGWFNSGDYNTGHCNSGHYNTGDHNTGNRNTGFFNTIESNVTLFNKPTDLKHDSPVIRKLISMTSSCLGEAWISSEEMTAEEKANNPSHTLNGGYIKKIDLKDLWQRRWKEEFSEDDKEFFKSLPNFDAAVFEEITGIKV